MIKTSKRLKTHSYIRTGWPTPCFATHDTFLLLFKKKRGWMWSSSNRGRARERENHKASFIWIWIVQTLLAPTEAPLLWGVVNLSGLPTDRLSNKHLTKAWTVQRGGEEREREGEQGKELKGGVEGQMPDTERGADGAWWILKGRNWNPLKLPKRPATIIAVPLGSLSIRVAVAPSSSCGRWRASRRRRRRRQGEEMGPGPSPSRHSLSRALSFW